MQSVNCSKEETITKNEAESTIAYLKDYSDVVRIVDAEALRVAEDEGLSKCHWMEIYRCG